MKTYLRFGVGLLIAASMLVGVTAVPAMAQDKAKDAKAASPAKAEKGKPVVKVLFQNDKTRVVEVTFRPGDAGQSVARPFRVARALKGGTLTRMWADGKVDKETFKTGEVKVFEPTAAYIPKNEGKSDVVLYVVFFKEPKK